MGNMLQVRIDDELKAQATLVFDQLGIDLSTAVRMFLKKSVAVNGIPFEVKNGAQSVATGNVKNVDRVSHYKQDDLKKVLNVLTQAIDELWVFGSAVTPYCKPESDLDICIVGDNITKEDIKLLSHAPRHAMDLLSISHADFEKEREDINSVFHDVYTKGLLVYRKGIGVL